MSADHTSATLCAVLILTGLGYAQTAWHVDTTGTAPGSGSALDPYTSIQYAVSQSPTVSGDSLLIAPGTYGETVETSKDLTFIGPSGGLQTIIDGTGLGSSTVIVRGGAAVRFEGIMLRGGTGVFDGMDSEGGGLLIREGASVEMAQCIVRDNSGSIGAGIYVEDGRLKLVECQLLENVGHSPWNSGQAALGVGVAVGLDCQMEATRCIALLAVARRGPLSCDPQALLAGSAWLLLT